MSDLISKQAALQAIDDLINKYDSQCEVDAMAGAEAAREAVDSVKAAEIVRCGECKHYYCEHNDACPPEWCRESCELDHFSGFSTEWYKHKDWFCADGERRTE